jgi:uncharacterized protein YndB with AHSA1/START domain
MTTTPVSTVPITADPELDLVLERVIDVRPELVWAAWTEPRHLKEWFVPAPWSLAECEVDLRPGGRFRTVMRSPDGTEYPDDGCYLEVVPMRRLVFTDTLAPGFRPVPAPSLGFTAVITIEPHGDGATRYVATAIHGTDATRRRHEEMGFHDGWGKALDQLVALAKRM